MLVVSESDSDETIFWNFKVSFEMDDQSQITSKISNYSKKYMTLVRDFNFIPRNTIWTTLSFQTDTFGLFGVTRIHIQSFMVNCSIFRMLIL
jgi:hypothetical protein